MLNLAATNEITELCKGVRCVDLGESFQTHMSLFSQFLFKRDSYSNAYLLAKFGFDTAENEPYYFVSSSSREFEFQL